METAKAVVDVPSPCDGKIKKLYGETGEVILTGSPLVEFESDKQTTDAGTVVGEIKSTNETLDETSTITPNIAGQKSIKVTPAVRAIAKKMSVDLSLVTPTGKNGLITINDVRSFSNIVEAAGQLIPLKGVRKSMAKIMEKAHAEVVPVTITEDAIFNPTHDFTDTTIQIIQALIYAVKKEPNFNAWYNGTTLASRVFDDINLGVAMDTPDGLFVPVIQEAQKLTRIELRAKINEYKASVTDRTIDPTNLKNCTITLSNFGNMAGKYASPIVVPPTVAILGIGKMRDVVAPYNDEIKICKMLPVSLTFDHRAITGGESARFIGEFVQSLVTK